MTHKWTNREKLMGSLQKKNCQPPCGSHEQFNPTSRAVCSTSGVKSGPPLRKLHKSANFGILPKPEIIIGPSKGSYHGELVLPPNRELTIIYANESISSLLKLRIWTGAMYSRTKLLEEVQDIGEKIPIASAKEHLCSKHVKTWWTPMQGLFGLTWTTLVNRASRFLTSV